MSKRKSGPVPTPSTSEGVIQSKPGESFASFYNRTSNLRDSDCLLFKTNPDEPFKSWRRRQTRIFPELIDAGHWLGTKPLHDQAFVNRELEKGIFVGVAAEPWAGSCLMILIGRNRFRRPPLGGQEIFKKLKANDDLSRKVLESGLPVEEICEIVQVGLILGRHFQAEPPSNPRKVNVEPPVVALSKIRKRRGYYIRALLRAADEMEHTILPVLNRFCCWGDPDKPSEPVWEGPFQKLPDSLKKVATIVRQMQLPAPVTLRAYADRRLGDRSFDSAIHGLVSSFRYATGKPQYRLAGDIINHLFEKEFESDQIKKITRREARRLEKVAALRQKKRL